MMGAVWPIFVPKVRKPSRGNEDSSEVTISNKRKRSPSRSTNAVVDDTTKESSEIKDEQPKMFEFGKAAILFNGENF